MRLILLIFAFLLIFSTSWAQEVPRTILALYKGENKKVELIFHALHEFFEMPLNHLGLVVKYWDIEDGLPDLSKFPPLRGILTAYYSEEMEAPEAYLDWLKNQMELGVKCLIVGDLGARRDKTKRSVDLSKINSFLEPFGLKQSERWIKLDPTVNYLFSDSRYVYFEEINPTVPAGIQYVERTDKTATIPFIEAEILNERIPIATIGKKGSLILGEYLHKFYPDTELGRWVVNPFYFFREVYDTTTLPKIDVTTLNGRRLYFSHIDGDAWRSISQIPRYAEKKVTCAEVIMKEAISPYPDLPVTVAPIVGDLDPDWYGNEVYQNLATNFFQMPQVQGGSHTLSHPFEWGYYDDPQVVEKESKEFDHNGVQLISQSTTKHDYGKPRAYFKKPFDLTQELVGSIDYIQRFMPEGKKARLLQWSGNCVPFEQALEVLSKHNLFNINGGDSRFDKQYPSYSSVCPVGRSLGDYVQIYAVNSNENTYTDNWTSNFHAFKYLTMTFEKTETPIRVKGMNIYYHMYSGEHEASLSALLSNLDYVRTQKIIPIEAEYYAEIGKGFYTAKFIQEGEMSWRVEDRGATQTIRFDRASDKWVDFEKSRGVLGATHYQGCLYIALEPDVTAPIVSLKDTTTLAAPPRDNTAYLLESRWRIGGLAREAQKFSFEAHGYGPLEMTWIVPEGGRYEIRTEVDNQPLSKMIDVADDGRLSCHLDLKGYVPLRFTVTRLSAGEVS